MPFDKFLISPFKTGLQTDVKRWMVLDDAFTKLQNAYVFRGRVRKRFGSLLMGITPLLSRLRVNLQSMGSPLLTDGSGDASGTVPGSYFAPGQAFSVGSQIFTVYQTGTPADTLSTGTGSATYNTSTGAFTITGAAINTQVYFYPALPVMGITQYEFGTINNHPSLAFDTEFAYIFIPASGWQRSGNAVWHGDNTKYFWSNTWQGLPGTTVLYVTNFNAQVGAGSPGATDDPIWYSANANTAAATWVPRSGITASGADGIFFLPAPAGTPLAPFTGPFVQTCRMIFTFKGHQLLLYTIENDNSSTTGTGTATAYPQRCRYSFFGNPLARNAWYEENQEDNAAGAVGNNYIYAGAGYIDAATEEQIISAEFVKDRLIVYFERSAWEIAYTGNQVKPFEWNKLNTELGSQSTFSTVPFDTEILTIGNTGVHQCNGSNVRRIDDLIPDEIFEDFSAKPTSVIRIQGIRDYEKELVYWAFLTQEGEASGTKTFPDQIMVYNYKTGSWAFNDDCFTAFGYFEQQSDTTWASSVPTTWEQANSDWVGGVSAANQRQIIAGTPEGFVLIIDPDSSRNAASAQITTMTIAATGIITLVIYNNNLSRNTIEFPSDGDFILFENIVTSDPATASYLNGNIFAVASVNSDGNTITVNTNDRIINDVQIPPLTSGTYLGGGTIARVSNIEINTKAFNPYDKEDTNVFIGRIDFAVQKTIFGEITVDYYPSTSEVSMIESGAATTALMGNSILETFPYDPTFYPLEIYQELLWHPVYFQASGENIQFVISMSSNQMINPAITLSDFELEAMTLYTERTGRMG